MSIFSYASKNKTTEATRLKLASFRAGVLLTLLLSLGIFYYFQTTQAANSISPISDLISTSAPGIDADHTLTFYSPQTIPAGGRIVFTPTPEYFYVSEFLSADDVDVATGPSFSGPFSQRDLTTTPLPSLSEDAVSVASGTSGGITILLATGPGMSIPAGSYVQIKIGQHATHNASGIYQITNPTSTGSYRLRLNVYDNSNALLENGTAMVAIIEQVGTLGGTNDFFPPTIFNGLPTGTIPASASNLEMSVETDTRANCKYGTVASTSYTLMPYSFSTIDQFFHYIFTTTSPNTNYTYYVRCKSRGGIESPTDYVLSFSVASTVGPPYTGPGVAGIPPGGGGFGQSFPPAPSIPNMSLSGFASPATTLSVLKDGVVVSSGIQPTATGAFQSNLTISSQGNTTVAVYATDPSSARSAPYSVNVTAVAGIQTVVTGAVIPPILKGPKDNSFELGSSILFSGYAPPLSSVEFFLTQSGRRPGNIPSSKTQADGSGKFSYTVKTGALPKGQYEVRARAVLGGATSPFSTPYPIGLGVTAKAFCSNQPDINNDNRVNLVDFSMFLFDFNKATPRSDFNCDTKVNLTDFSIMLFNWSG